MSERCEAFKPREVDHAILQTYERNSSSGSFISKIMLSLQESPAARDAALKEHLQDVQARAQLRQLMGVLPVVDPDEGVKRAHNTSHLETKTKVRLLESSVSQAPSNHSRSVRLAFVCMAA